MLNSSNEFEFLVSTLPGHPDGGLLRAAARAGATAILNLEAVSDVESALDALSIPLPGRIGVRVDARELLDMVPAELFRRLDVIILAADALPAFGEDSAARQELEELRAPNSAILLECTTIDDARRGAALGVDALVAKGHESGGRVGDETTLVLVQRLATQVALPVFAQGGIGLHTVAACMVAGCAGAVLDAQLLLARESSASEFVQASVARMVGDETVCIGADLGSRYRVFGRPGTAAVTSLQQLEQRLGQDSTTDDERQRRWREAVKSAVEWSGAGTAVWPIGQDASFAAPLSRQFRSIAGILRGLKEAARRHVALARDLTPLGPQSPLARSHATEYPILQGPMTRVSDTAPFAEAVAAGGALPFLALALLRGPQVRSLLQSTSELLDGRPWGVGILGFVPLELREEQFAAIEEFRPPFALIAGGRPDQAVKFERLGIKTYLHVPAPALLKMFLDSGARRFVFEGRECGGHVGPRTSFVLWELMVNALLDAIAGGVSPQELHVVFAGGLHDAQSAAMLSAIVAPLAEAGARVGALIGTAYLFTEEAVNSGAIVEGFQDAALACTSTALLETGPGHATRCATTPFCDTFHQRRRELMAEGRSAEDIRARLEMLNLGRLRVASKGIQRDAEVASPSGPAYVTLDVNSQRQNGMYMIGQVAGLRDRVCRIVDLHRDVSLGSIALLRRLPWFHTPTPEPVPPAALRADVAIIGMGCLLPNAADVRTLWNNVLNRVDAIREVPAERFDVSKYYDPDRHARDRIYSKWGGFLDEVPFDPVKYGMPPNAVSSIDPFQLLTLEVVDQALRDAGYDNRSFDRERTSVILGASGGVGDLGFRYGIRAGLPMYLEQTPPQVLGQLPQWTEDSFAGVLLNVAAGRVANRLDLGGLNFTVDAACASSLAAVFLGARELEAGGSDMVLVGGIDTVNSPFGYLCFSSAQALSPRGRCSTFDESADGIAISEGLAVLVLKRLADAERDGDRIYAVIRAVAGSSDGRGKGLTAPRPEGQMRVLQRAYAAAGISPASIGLIEAHGTGTVAGDTAEVAALSHVFAAAGAAPQQCALGSIKSMIGHTKSAAGVSGLLKVALALHHKVLPPTLHVATPNAKLREEDTPFYVNTETRPWVSPTAGQPRRAGVSSFGFGGTNFHVVVEEYDPQAAGTVPESAPADSWPAELAVWSADSPRALLDMLDDVDDALSGAPDVPLRSVAAAVCRSCANSAGALRLAIVADTTEDLRRKAALSREAIQAGRASMSADGVHLGSPAAGGSGVAFLFPGQGAQYVGMHRELALYFPEFRHALEGADQATRDCFDRPLSRFVLPPPTFTKAEEERRMRELTDTAVAQPALGAVETGLCRLFERLGVRPDFTAGHSYGEYVALWAAGVFSRETLFKLSIARGRLMKEACGDGIGTMAAVTAPRETVEQVIAAEQQVWIANLNAPRQTVIAGRTEAVDRTIEALKMAGITARRIPVACAFHSPLVGSAKHDLAALLASVPVRPPRMPVFSNSLAAPYPRDPEQIGQVLGEHIVRPVRFFEQIEAMYAAGARVFIEMGPRGILSNLVRETLAGRDALIVPVNVPGSPEIPQLLTALARLTVAGTSIDFEVLWRGRSIPRLSLRDLAQAGRQPLAPHVWMVSGGRARRHQQAPTTTDVVTEGAETTSRPSPSPAGAKGQPDQPLPLVPVAVSPAGSPSLCAASAKGVLMQSQRPTQLDIQSDDHDAVMRQFQQLMSQFLQTQALVMTTYLQGVPAGLSPSTPAIAALPFVPSPLGAVDASAPTQAAVQSAAAVQFQTLAAPNDRAESNASERHGPEPNAESVAVTARAVAVSAVTAPVIAPVAAALATSGNGHSSPDRARLTEAEVLARLVRIVSDRTGYPEEMLAVDANIEADLGIDSIKRMEVLAAFQEMHVGPERGAFQEALERLTALKTLRENAAALTEILGARDAALA